MCHHTNLMFPKFWTSMENLSLHVWMLRYDLMWLSGATAVCQWYMKHGIIGQCVENASNSTQQVGWIFEVLLKLLYSWFYEQRDSWGKRAEGTISGMWKGKVFCQSPSHIYNFESWHFNLRHLFFLATFPHWKESGTWQAVWKIRDFFGFFVLNVLTEFISIILAGY